MTDELDILMKDIVTMDMKDQAILLAQIQTGQGLFAKMGKKQRQGFLPLVSKMSIWAARIGTRGIECECKKGVIYREINCPFCGMSFLDLVKSLK